MPKKYDAGTQERALRMFDEQSGEYASVTAACAAVAGRLGLPKDTVRGWVRKRAEQGVAGGLSASEREEVKALRAKVRRLEEDNAVLRSAALFFAGGTRPPQPMIMDFIRSQEAAGRSVESVCRVLREQGLQVAARTYRASKTGYAGLSAGLLAMAYLTNAIHSLVYRFDTATGAGLPAGAGGTVRAAEDDRPAGACGATGRPGRGHPVRLVRSGTPGDESVAAQRDSPRPRGCQMVCVRDGFLV